MLDFFSNSPFGPKWRVLYWALQHVLHSPWPAEAFPDFDRQLHHLLCSELKQLYVLLTRWGACWLERWKAEATSVPAERGQGPTVVHKGAVG